MSEQRDVAVLIIDDSPYDAELAAHELSRRWPQLTWQRVQELDGFVAALDERHWSVVLADYSLPGFGPQQVLEILKSRGQCVPLIVVSGVLSTEDAVEVMRCGAADFVAKDDLPRLRGAVERELAACEERLRARSTEIRLAATERILRVLQQAVEQSPVSVVMTSPDGTIEYANRTLCEMTGYSLDELIGKNPRLWQSGQTSPETYRELWRTVLSGEEWRGEMLNRKKGGELFWETARISPIFDESGRLAHIVGIKDDVTEERRNREQLDRISRTDPLTGLPNRAGAAERLAAAVAHAAAAGSSFVVLLVDVDQFRMINDSLGHAIGDEFLKCVAGRIQLCLRQGDMVARTGGDEFTLLLPAVTADAVATQVASRLLIELAQPFELAGHELTVTCSIGAAMYPRDGSDADGLLKSADAAMYQAKQDGRDTMRFYSPELNDRLDRRLRIENLLRRAAERGELALHYQPQVDLRSGEISGAEALLRWTCAELGTVSPGEFIPVAEESPLILSIGKWVMEHACAQIVAWKAAGLPWVRVAVNVSARQFADPAFPAMVRETIAAHRLRPDLLEIEVTESAIMRDAAGAAAVARLLRELGVQLSLDDFGTGYSSLAHLSQLPLQTLKIDQSFVRDITSNPTNAMIATATIALAHNLGMSVIAEGVETEGQANYLRGRGCDRMQGYLFSRAVPPEEFAGLVRSHGAPQSPAPEQRPTLLLVDDEPNILHALRRLFRRDGYHILTAESAAEGFRLLAENAIQVIVSDQRMPEMSGTEFLSKVKDLYPETVRIVLSGYTDLASVTDAINRGAIYRFLTKPWDDEQLRDQIRGAFRHGQTSAQN